MKTIIVSLINSFEGKNAAAGKKRRAGNTKLVTNHEQLALEVVDLTKSVKKLTEKVRDAMHASCFHHCFVWFFTSFNHQFHRKRTM